MPRRPLPAESLTVRNGFTRPCFGLTPETVAMLDALPPPWPPTRGARIAAVLAGRYSAPEPAEVVPRREASEPCGRLESVEVRLPVATLAALDAERGAHPRGAFLRWILEALENNRFEA